MPLKIYNAGRNEPHSEITGPYEALETKPSLLKKLKNILTPKSKSPKSKS